MSYATFKQKVLELVQRSESGVKVIFHRDNGNHIADFSDGTRIMGIHTPGKSLSAGTV